MNKDGTFLLHHTDTQVRMHNLSLIGASLVNLCGQIIPPYILHLVYSYLLQKWRKKAAIVLSHDDAVGG